MNTSATSDKQRFGTFGGVFTPSILTILGVIMFTRTGFVVGEAGIRGALIILAICEGIVLLTAISLSAIATNTQVKGGGAYYLISRVLGPEFGGAIGIALFLAQALSVPFYILGFTEALVHTFPGLLPYFHVVSFSTAVLLFGINYIGADWAIKAQYFVLAILALSIFSMLGGAWVKFDPTVFAANWEPNYTKNFGFWSIFAIYFPAVTGIMAGVNMSGDLKDPGKSLVRGTFAAVWVGAVVYALEMTLCGGSQTRSDMIAFPYEMLMINALWGTAYLIAAGVFSATVSSALGSYLGAPRVLQALSRDRIFGVLKPFRVGSKKGDEPRRALWLTFLLTLGVLWYASTRDGAEAFNFVASLLTMFFLCTYGMVNVAAFVESLGANPSFRPRFKFYHWTTAMIGALACGGVMFLIDARAAVVAIITIVILYGYVRRYVVTVAFGDARRGFHYSALARNLRALGTMKPDPKNWRPTILVLSGNPKSRQTLVQYGIWLEAGLGIIAVAHVIKGELGNVSELRKGALESIKSMTLKEDMTVFPEIVVTKDFDEGVRVLLQSHSIGPIKPNMVMMGWPRERERVGPFVGHLNDIRALGRSALVVVDKGLPAEGMRRIDVWWRGKENGSLMLILAHLLTSNWEWRRARIRVLREVDNEAGRKPAYDSLTQLVEAARINAEVIVIVSDKSFEDILEEYSHQAAVVFLGFQPPTADEADAFYDRYQRLLAKTPTAILISSSGEADLTA